ncbi:MAG: hypothetical protein DI603_19900 [Roseateles depolymerans]|uniref:DoxX family protein n=1 Tax=Roseateles depolymerans TaxID=76731 RepID=A0A2W5DCW9_9BURK|nr:MAG: hypothetical protein DI603_19900 [Roseateles depolymerans]
MSRVETATITAEPLWWRVLLLLLSSAYLQGGLVKLSDFAGAQAEMTHFGLQPAAPFAAAVIVLELVAPLLIVFGPLRWRRLAALALAGFTLAASLMANAFWAAAPELRMPLMNAFFEHLGLVAGFVIVAMLGRPR